MSFFQTVRPAQLANVVLRFLPFLAKLGLTLYMTRFMGLADVGVYGLVLGAVGILTALLGQNLTFSVVRDISGESPSLVLRKMRDQALYCAFNYLVLAAVIFAVIVSGVTGLESRTLLAILLLTVLEGLGNMAHNNISALNRQLLANWLLFIRAAVWIVPVVVLGVVYPAYRTVNVVLYGWIIGGALCLAATLWCGRRLPWREVLPLPMDWRWLWHSLKGSFLFWLGGMGLMAGGYVDRFVVEHFLTMEDVGVLTFYSSFAGAIFLMIQSGVAAFVQPRLITLHRRGDGRAFAREADQARWQTGVGAGLMSVLLAALVPLLGHFLDRPALVVNADILWLLLFAAWVRSNSEITGIVLYARHQDRPIWLGNLLFLIPAFGCNALFVALFGFIGVGYGAVVSAIFLFAWRFWFVRESA